MPSQSTAAAPLLSPELLARLERLELVSRKIFRGRLQGERRSRRKGRSVEFDDFRDYVPGDDLRFLDWNLYARLDRLYLKLFLEEEELHVYPLIDASGSMNFGDPTKLHYAKQTAAALGFVALCRADRVKIEPLGAPRRFGRPVFRGRRSLWRLLEYLDRIEPGVDAPLADAVKNFCLRNTSKGVAILISDLLDKSGYQTAIRALLAQQMDVYVIHILCPEELDPPVQGDLKLIDCEDQDATEITVSRPLLNRYKRTLAAFIDGAREFCARRGAAYLMTSTATPLDQFLLGGLRRRGLLR